MVERYEQFNHRQTQIYEIIKNERTQKHITLRRNICQGYISDAQKNKSSHQWKQKRSSRTELLSKCDSGSQYFTIMKIRTYDNIHMGSLNDTQLYTFAYYLSGIIPKSLTFIQIIRIIAVPVNLYKLKETPSTLTQIIVFVVHIVVSCFYQEGYTLFLYNYFCQYHMFDMMLYEIFQIADMVAEVYIQIQSNLSEILQEQQLYYLQSFQ